MRCVERSNNHLEFRLVLLAFELIELISAHTNKLGTVLIKHSHEDLPSLIDKLQVGDVSPLASVHVLVCALIHPALALRNDLLLGLGVGCIAPVCCQTCHFVCAQVPLPKMCTNAPASTFCS